MKTRIKKTNKVSNNENSNKIVVKKIKKSNSKTNYHLNDLSNYFDLKERDICKKKFESKKSKTMKKADSLNASSSNTKLKSVGTEEEQNSVESIEENVSNLPNTDDNESILTESAKIEMLHNMNCSVILVKLEDIMKSQTIENSSNLPGGNEEIPSNTLLKGLGRKKTKRVTFNENQNKTHSSSKSHLRNILKSNDIKEKDTSENKFESKNKTCTLRTSFSNTKLKSVGTEEEQNSVESIEENVANLPNTDDNESILTESAKLEIGHRRPTYIVKAYYKCSSDSDCKHKTKLSEVTEVVHIIQNNLKRFKPS